LTTTTQTTKKMGKWRRRALIAAGITAVGVPGLWVAIHEVPGLGPALADGARALFGPKAVAWAEDVSYGIQDRIDQWRYKDAKPKTFWDAPSDAPIAPPPPSPLVPVTVVSAAASGSASAGAPPAEAPSFPPPAFSAPVPAVAADGDGTWLGVRDNTPPGQSSALVKAVVHPDPKRNFAAVAVIAVDLSRVDLHVVAGTQEPQSDKVPSEHRPGIVPKDAFADLVAAFNGGFKATHGHYGMMIDGETFIPPRDIGCTVALYKDGSLKIRTWSDVKASEPTMNAYRQTPPCLVQSGKVNETLEGGEYNRNWGSTVSGETVIRRSAIGLDKTGKVLFYGLGEAVTAQSLARAMRAAGAEDAAQLDVNYSYPRFLFFDKAEGTEPPRVAATLIPGIKYQKTEYTGGTELRDFFYLTRKHPSS
jgi:Phosphodiester glycosidase